MSDLSWIDRATETAFEAGKQSAGEMVFRDSLLCVELKNTYRDKIPTAGERLALEAVASLAFGLARKRPGYKGWDALAVGELLGCRSRQELYQSALSTAELALRDPDASEEDARGAVSLEMHDMCSPKLS